jgi:hypothetical protein
MQHPQWFSSKNREVVPRIDLDLFGRLDYAVFGVVRELREREAGGRKREREAGAGVGRRKQEQEAGSRKQEAGAGSGSGKQEQETGAGSRAIGYGLGRSGGAIWRGNGTPR